MFNTTLQKLLPVPFNPIQKANDILNKSKHHSIPIPDKTNTVILRLYVAYLHKPHP